MSTQEKLDTIEKLAAIEHERWADWQKWMHNQLTPELCIPYELWERWQKQIITPYEELPEHSKQSDRDQVMRYWPIIQAIIDSAKREAKIEMLKNMKKSLMVARVNPGLKPLQLPEDARIQQMIADEFDRNIAQLEQSEESK